MVRGAWSARIAAGQAAQAYGAAMALTRGEPAVPAEPHVGALPVAMRPTAWLSADLGRDS